VDANDRHGPPARRDPIRRARETKEAKEAGQGRGVKGPRPGVGGNGVGIHGGLTHETEPLAGVSTRRNYTNMRDEKSTAGNAACASVNRWKRWRIWVGVSGDQD